MRTMFVWRRASRLPTVIDSAASTQINGCVDVVGASGRRGNHEDQRDEAGRLGRDRQERGDRRRRALVRVGGPRVERHRRDLEGEADDDEHDADDSRLISLSSSANGAPISVSYVVPVTPNSRLMP